VTIVDSETGGDYTKINVNQADGDYTGNDEILKKFQLNFNVLSVSNT